MTREEKIMNTVNFCRANGFEALAKMAEGFEALNISERDLDENLNLIWERAEKAKKRERNLRENYAHAISR